MNPTQSRTPSNLSTFPALAQWIVDHCASHTDVFVREAPRMIDSCLRFDAKIPNEYGWRFINSENFSATIPNGAHAKEINRIYWTDQARIIEAYSVTSFWRGAELLKPAIRSLNIRELITPAVLSRSLLELVCAFLYHANTLDKTFRDLSFPDDSIVVSQELEETVIKMMWGTRCGNPETHLKQTNVLTFIQKISKNPAAKDVLPNYEYLCDIAHPSFIGNTRFWSHITKVNPDGSEQRVVSRFSEGNPAGEILDKVLWVLGWSSSVLCNAHAMTQSALKCLLDKLQ